MKILLIEDDASTSLAISQTLTQKKYAVDAVNNGETGLELAQLFPYDVILLDIMLPQLDGITVCRRLRSQQNHTPILLLTAKNHPRDCVMGLEAGADDYLVKPFDWAELLARIQALSRRGQQVLPDVLRWENLVLNQKTHEVTYQGQLLHLTPTEYSLLELFLRHPQRVFSRQVIIDQIWTLDKVPGEETISSHIKALRQKLKAVGMTQNMIKTVYGFGYRLGELQECLSFLESEKQQDCKIDRKSSDEEKIKPSSAVVSQKAIAQKQVQSNVSQIWETIKGTVRQDMATLLELIRSLASTDMVRGGAQKQTVIALSHRLAGTVGIFGKTQESNILRQIEELLLKTTPSQETTSQNLLDLVTSLEQIWKPDQPTVFSSAIKREDCLLWIGVEEKWRQSLQTTGLLQDWTNIAVSDLKEAKSFLTQTQPRGLVIDLDLLESREEGLIFLEQLRQEKTNLPFIILDTYNDLSYRLEIARLGKGLFLQKPLTSDRLLKAAIKVLQLNQVTDVTLMLIDDDPNFLEVLKATLTPWGFNVVSLSNPQQFWPVLEATNPDLLILDLEMPHFSGLNLCQAVRKDDRFCSVPILFLSGHDDGESIRQMLVHGADCYLPKTIAVEELIECIFEQIESDAVTKKLE
ncbi:two component transcriptional regulator, winged helix family [Rippkaea orientalis PCC 8801]|uniref:Two component transcriptional regulator, winged helix family n=1 Tax=Rippkaea orientalis (strain PCC 8801 / RF-1) TaxID=41431 RepID=B7K2S9_RIPO1|nr:response regulator [Rippkaea orientalis]ACK67630.1 two component transcriptional regulator, winged helix family [Rippkaea orientalis PCC 8801]